MGPFELDSIRRLSRARTNHPWLETIVVAAAFYGVGSFVRPDDPLLTQAAFPWSIFAPILMGLRYGFAHGFVAAVGMHAAAGVQAWAGAGIWPLPFGYTLGLLLCSLIVGEFRDIWEQRLVQLERSNEYRQARLEEFTRSYHVLKISHDELEQEYAGRRTSLRSALLSAREKLVDAVPERVGEELLELLSDFVSARAGTYHRLVDGELDPLPAATLGSGTPLSAGDPLLQRALTTGATVSVRPEDTSSMAARGQSDPIVVIPVLDAYRRVHAVVGIHQIPFFALTERNLQIATIVAGRFGDFLHATARLPLRLEEELYWFLYHALRCMDLANVHALSSCLIVCRLTDASTAPLYIRTILDQARGLDQAFPWQEGGQWYLLMLMPLTTRQGLERFMVRFDAYLTEIHGVGLTKGGIEVAHTLLDPPYAVGDLEEFLVSEIGQTSRIVEALALLGGSDREQRRAASAGAH